MPFSQSKRTPAQTPTPFPKPTSSKLSEALQFLGWGPAESAAGAADVKEALSTMEVEASWLDAATCAYLRQPDHRGLYASLCAAGPPDVTTAEQIQIDIVRTDLGDGLSDSELEVRREALRRVLQAFSLHDAQTGYVQGMDSIAAAALLTSECGVMHLDGTWSSSSAAASEEKAFWWLVHVTSHLLDGFFSRGMPALWTELGVLRVAVTSLRPKLIAHLDSLGFDFSLLAPGWYLTLFQRVLDAAEVAPILSAFTSGALQPVHVALGIVLTCEATLFAAADFDQAASALFGTASASRSRRAPKGVLAHARKVATLLPPKKLKALRGAQDSTADGSTRGGPAETPRARQSTRRWFESPWAGKLR